MISSDIKIQTIQKPVVQWGNVFSVDNSKEFD